MGSACCAVDSAGQEPSANQYSAEAETAAVAAPGVNSNHSNSCSGSSSDCHH